MKDVGSLPRLTACQMLWFPLVLRKARHAYHSEIDSNTKASPNTMKVIQGRVIGAGSRMWMAPS